MQVDNPSKGALVVFGGSGRLGRALVAGARRTEAFETVAACGFRNAPDGDLNFQFDALDRHALADFADKLAKRQPRVTAVVHCIGATRDRLLVQTSRNDWDHVLNLNLRSAFLIAQTFLPLFLSQRRGHLIFIGSHAGACGRAGQSAYAAAKAGLTGLAQSIAREYGRRNIQANVVLPGLLPGSPSVEAMPAEVADRLLSENILGGPSNAEEITGFILHLLSMRKVSGQIFNLDSRILPHS